MKLTEIYNVCVSESKRKTDKMIPWVYYVMRPISILLTKPLLKTNITPVNVTFASMVATLIGFVLIGFGQETQTRLWGFFAFIVWGLLDCIDGNIARCKGLASTRGALWDATGGYMALTLMYFSVGIGAFNDTNALEFLDKYLYIVLGGLTAIMSIFPRLVMQKKKADGGTDTVKGVADKANYSITKIIALNVESAIGITQVILFLAIIFHFLNIFILCYFFINIVITVYTLYNLLK
ncbi:MAG: CDP-alcohol phosphatidyltransferase family protein [Prevotella sp.]|nr:CDP-alcohol phosphatidyltransferase family protein [Prevotella sp.]MBR6189504.1 CDP-alcohol phosphatidyltransferase family protein [Prevotella sp.]